VSQNQLKVFTLLNSHSLHDSSVTKLTAP